MKRTWRKASRTLGTRTHRILRATDPLAGNHIWRSSERSCSLKLVDGGGLCSLGKWPFCVAPLPSKRKRRTPHGRFSTWFSLRSQLWWVIYGASCNSWMTSSRSSGDSFTSTEIHGRRGTRLPRRRTAAFSCEAAQGNCSRTPTQNVQARSRGSLPQDPRQFHEHPPSSLGKHLEAQDVWSADPWEDNYVSERPAVIRPQLEGAERNPHDEVYTEAGASGVER